MLFYQAWFFSAKMIGYPSAQVLKFNRFSDRDLGCLRRITEGTGSMGSQNGTNDAINCCRKTSTGEYPNQIPMKTQVPS